MKIAVECPDQQDTSWTHRSQLEDGRVGCAVAWQEDQGDCKAQTIYLGRNKEVYDVESFAI